MSTLADRLAEEINKPEETPEQMVRRLLIEGGHTVGEIAEQAGVSLSAISRELDKLNDKRLADGKEPVAPVMAAPKPAEQTPEAPKPAISTTKPVKAASEVPVLEGAALTALEYLIEAIDNRDLAKRFWRWGLDLIDNFLEAHQAEITQLPQVTDHWSAIAAAVACKAIRTKGADED